MAPAKMVGWGSSCVEDKCIFTAFTSISSWDLYWRLSDFPTVFCPHASSELAFCQSPSRSILAGISHLKLSKFCIVKNVCLYSGYYYILKASTYVCLFLLFVALDLFISLSVTLCTVDVWKWVNAGPYCLKNHPHFRLIYLWLLWLTNKKWPF